MDGLTRLQLALIATRPGMGRAVANQVREHGHSVLMDRLGDLPPSERDSLAAQAEHLHCDGIGALVLGLNEYPDLLAKMDDSPPVLFYSGPLQILDRPAIGICGARNVSPEGLHAAEACGKIAATQGVVSVSGYARGVDTMTHAASLRAGGETIIVLAEGISHFRVKKVLIGDVWERSRALVLSQFAPAQTWSAGAAMARNSVIVGLGMALVVVEAGDKGGTLAAGNKALNVRRRVLVLDFPSMHPGNNILLERGAVAVRDRDELGEFLNDLVHVADEAERHSARGPVQYSLEVDANSGKP